VDLTDRVALVTGAGVRIGRAIALGLASAGMHVAVHYHSSEAPAREVVDAIRAGGRNAMALQADLADMASLTSLLPRAAESLGPVSVLVNSASIFERGTLAATTEQSWERHLNINARAPFFLCQAYMGQLPPNTRGHIINIADWRALRPGTQYMAYTLSKGALVTLTLSLALALAPTVQVNALAPGAILPPPQDDGGYFQRLGERLPLRRTGDPQEVVDAVLYLLGSDFVTGEILHITGGEHL
jgi:NAD(P)-dependent dehydrogenase (short-subunit alcohol dehydrogenase family)